jgi:RNA polymerase sigma-70 factor (ECF subfamily)
MGILNEKELVNSIILGDKNAEKQFVEYYYDKVKLIVDIRLWNREDRQEIVNDILVAAIIKIRAEKFIFSENSSLTKYVHGITRNTITQYYKDYYYRIDKERELEEKISQSSNPLDSREAEYEEKDDIEFNKRVWAESISKLKKKYRKVIYLKYYQDLSIGEISEIMDIPPQKVSDYLKYAKQLLLKAFKNKII